MRVRGNLLVLGCVIRLVWWCGCAGFGQRYLVRGLISWLVGAGAREPAGSRLRYLVRVADRVLGGQLLSWLVCYVMWVNTISILPHGLRVKHFAHRHKNFARGLHKKFFTGKKKNFFFERAFSEEKFFLCRKNFLACKWVNLKIHKHVSFPP